MMVGEDKTTFRIPHDNSVASVLAGLEDSFSLLKERTESRRRLFFDTFDWRLWNARSTLGLEEGGELRLVGPGGECREDLGGRSQPDFAWDLPDGSLRQALGTLIKMRRLLPLAQLEERRRATRVLDKEKKTVVRLAFWQGVARHPGKDHDPVELPSLITVSPVRGYSREARRLVRHLGEKVGLPRESDSDLALCLTVLGRVPGDYSSKLRLKLKPSVPAHEAMRQILKTLLSTMERNEDGVKSNLDSEFLHDFRVAIRRTRSALGQVKGVFPPDELERFREDFAWLGLRTGPCRDLDVLDLKIDEYKKDLAPEHREALAGLSRFVARRRGVERRRLLAVLRSKRYRDLKTSWQAFLGDPEAVGETSLANAHRPVKAVASERIWRLWKRIRKRGRSITSCSAPDELHALRIECKKLRYLLEFFRSLFDPRDMDGLIRSLKKLQDALGDFNDYAVHQDQLQELGEEMGREGKEQASTLMALGRLLEHLQWQGKAQQMKATEEIAPFVAGENQLLFRRLFRLSDGVGS